MEDKNCAKLGKVLIGDKEFRNKGLGVLLVTQMLRYCFLDLCVNYVHLYVYDWNKAAIKCYKKSGFKVNGKRKVTKFGNQTWIALDMEIRI